MKVTDRPFPGAVPVSYWLHSEKVAPKARPDARGLRGRWNCWFLSTALPPDAKPWAAAYANQTYHFSLIARLLTVRTEWSRK